MSEVDEIERSEEFETEREGMYLRVEDILCCLSDAKRSLDQIMEIEEKVREPFEPVSLLEECCFDYDF